MGGKRKNSEEGSELDANGENSPAQQRGENLGESENLGTPGARTSGRARKTVKAYDPSTAFKSPARKQPGTSPAASARKASCFVILVVFKDNRKSAISLI